MNYRSLILAGMAAVALSAQAQFMNPITKAMMDVYEQELKENPQDYEVLFRRANEYYNINQYLRAAADIDNAIKYTPADNTDLLFQEYLLRGNIALQTDNPSRAIDDFSRAIEIDPSSWDAINLRAYTAYTAGNYRLAKDDYNRLKRYDAYNIEPLIGLACIAVKENNIGLATEYTDRAIAIGSANPAAYEGRAQVRELMGNNAGAVEDLIMAISIDKNDSRALAKLVDMSNRDYNAVISGLSNAVKQAPSVGTFIYMRAIIAMAHYRYKAAIEDFNTIIDQNLYTYHGLHASLAECYYVTGKYQDALAEIGQAISMTTDNGEYYMTRALVRLAMGDCDKALASATDALDKLHGNVKAMRVKALCEACAGNNAAASDLLGEAIMDNPGDPLNYLEKAWLLGHGMNQTAAALSMYQRALNLDELQGIKSLKGFILLGVDRAADAISWIEGLLESTPDNDGSLNYYAACLYAHAQQPERALQCMEKSLENGYADYTAWTRYDYSLVSVAPLRQLPRFNELLEQYKYIF